MMFAYFCKQQFFKPPTQHHIFDSPKVVICHFPIFRLQKNTPPELREFPPWAKLRAHLTSHLQHALNGCGHIGMTSQLLQVPWSGWVPVVIGLQVEGDEKIHGKMLENHRATWKIREKKSWALLLPG